MDKLTRGDIDFSTLKKSPIQGTKSTIYLSDDTCIKMLDGLYDEERQALYRKFQEMDGISIENVILPQSLIVEDDKLLGFTMENFKNSMPLIDYFIRTRFIECKDLFEAVRKASLILRVIHKQGVICQDLTFDNILIDKNGVVKYCDMDGCSYGEHMSPFLSVLLKRFLVDFRKERITLVSKNLDRISLMLSFFYLTYLKEIQKMSKKDYYSLAEHVKTLENCKDVANILRSRGTNITAEIPYVDELIDPTDDYTIDRKKQLSLTKRWIYK